jgi:hypothetical protein
MITENDVLTRFDVSANPFELDDIDRFADAVQQGNGVLLSFGWHMRTLVMAAPPMLRLVEIALTHSDARDANRCL